MRHEPQGLEKYANTDPSLHYNTIDRRSNERWRGAWIYCLKHLDYESAELIHERNVPPSDECYYGDLIVARLISATAYVIRESC